MRSRVILWNILLTVLLVTTQPVQSGALVENQSSSNISNAASEQPLVEQLDHGNCTQAGIEQFPRPVFNQEERKHGWLLLYLIIAVYMFVSLSKVCEIYFVPSIQVLIDIFKINPDVAAATIMAGASSAPALAASLIAIFVAKSELGVSTMLGSAILSTTGVISLCGLFAGQVVRLTRWPILRDCFFFFFGLVILLVALIDSVIEIYESVLLCVLYFAYCAFMAYDNKIRLFFSSKFHFLAKDFEKDSVGPGQIDLSSTELKKPTARVATTPNTGSIRSLSDSLRKRQGASGAEEVKLPAKEVLSALVHAKEAESVMKIPDNIWWRIVWIFGLPYNVPFYLTIPDCRNPKYRKFYLITLVVSTTYITITSYFLVWMITIIGFTLNVSDTIMGLTFLSIGVTIPDVVAAMIVAREGYGDMAIGAAIGSNIFEVLFGIGFPWLMEALAYPDQPITVNDSGVAITSLLLVLSLVFLIGATAWNKWKMTRVYGAILMVWYLASLVFVSVYQLGLLGNAVLPTCSSPY